MAVTVNRSGVFIFLVVSMICMMDAKPSNNNDIDNNGSHGNDLQSRKHKYHQLLFLGGLKSWIALVLIKAKIILVSIAVAAVIIALKFSGIFKTAVPYSSHYPISYGPAYDFGPPIHLDHSAHDRYGHDWSSSNSYVQEVSNTKKPYSKYSGGKRRAR